MHRIDEALVFTPPLEVHADERLYDLSHLCARKRGPNHLAEGGPVALGAADRHLVPLGAVLVDTQDTDVSNVVLSAGVHAAGDVDFQFADIEQIVKIIESLLDLFRDRNRRGIGGYCGVNSRTRLPGLRDSG